MRELLCALLIATLAVPQFVFADSVRIGDSVKISASVKVGDQAKNLKVLPPWTMKLCPTELHATYDMAGALELKKKDNDCALWRDAALFLQQQIEDYKKLTEMNNKLVESYKVTQTLDQKRISELLTQLKQEIAEKNQYKYKPNYGWLWGVIGGGVALVATGVAVGLGVAYTKK